MARGIRADLQIRFGINTGHCTVGVFGRDVLRACKVVGSAMSIAARLQAESPPGFILCGYRTYALVRDRVGTRAREPLVVKGAAQPSEAWELLHLVEAAASPDRGPPQS
jgi:adenylate cyclase